MPKQPVSKLVYFCVAACLATVVCAAFQLKRYSFLCEYRAHNGGGLTRQCLPRPFHIAISFMTLVLALFGIAEAFAQKIQTANTGGPWTLVNNFQTPDMESAFNTLITTDDADGYDMDIISDFFTSWGFSPVLLELDAAPQQAAPEPAA